jgi:hypothetical protein
MSNAKSVKAKEGKINIEGKDYIVKFTMNSFIELEDEFGSIDEAMDAMRGTPIIDKDGNPIMEKVINSETGKVEIDPNTGKEIEEQKRKMSLKAIRKFLFAGLMTKQPELSEKDVGDIITLSNMGEIIKIITETMSDSLPKDNEGDDNQKN